MQGDERSHIALQSTYGSIQNSELNQPIQTGTVARELTRRLKKQI